MSRSFLHIQNLTFSYPESPTDIIHNLSCTLENGWTAIAGANGSGKSTLLKILSGELRPDSGNVNAPGLIRYCPQEVSGPYDLYATELNGFFEQLYDGDALAGRLFSRLNMDYDWPYRWDSLSFGERKRFQISSALATEPEILLLDEPTNHLDIGAKQLLLSVLEDFTGIGLLVSHDRTFLNRLCGNTLWLSPGSGRFFSGNYDDTVDQQNLERETLRRQIEENRKDQKKLKQELNKQRSMDEKRSGLMSKKGLSKHDSDMRGRIDLARLTSKDASSASSIRNLERRLDTLQQEQPDSISRKDTGVTMHGQVSSSDYLSSFDAGEISLPGNILLKHPDLIIRGDDRISLGGRNGAGKTSLIRVILDQLSGADKSFLYLPQEISDASAEELYLRFSGLNDSEKGEVVSHFVRLNGDAASVLEGGEIKLSPGELRKLFISMAFFTNVSLLVLDEPTNHLDLPSITAIETALSGFAAAILVVSHDETFISGLNCVSWTIEVQGEIRYLRIG